MKAEAVYTADGEVPGDLGAIRVAAQAWRDGPVKKTLAKVPARRARFSTWSDLDVQDLLNGNKGRFDG